MPDVRNNIEQPAPAPAVDDSRDHEREFTGPEVKKLKAFVGKSIPEHLAKAWPDDPLERRVAAASNDRVAASYAVVQEGLDVHAAHKATMDKHHAEVDSWNRKLVEQRRLDPTAPIRNTGRMQHGPAHQRQREYLGRYARALSEARAAPDVFPVVCRAVLDDLALVDEARAMNARAIVGLDGLVDALENVRDKLVGLNELQDKADLVRDAILYYTPSRAIRPTLSLLSESSTDQMLKLIACAAKEMDEWHRSDKAEQMRQRGEVPPIDAEKEAFRQHAQGVFDQKRALRFYGSTKVGKTLRDQVLAANDRLASALKNSDINSAEVKHRMKTYRDNQVVLNRAAAKAAGLPTDDESLFELKL